MTGSALSAEAIILELKLEPHPEGGFYRQTFRDATDGGRGRSTAIYYLLEKDQRSTGTVSSMLQRFGTIMQADLFSFISAKMERRWKP